MAAKKLSAKDKADLKKLKAMDPKKMTPGQKSYLNRLTRRDENQKPSDKEPWASTDFSNPKDVAAVDVAMKHAGTQMDLQQNRVNESDAFGSVQYTQNKDGTWSKKQSLSPEEQALLNQQRGLSADVFNKVQGGLANVGNNKQAISDNIYNEYMRQAGPQFKQEQADFEQMAAERGWTPDTPAYQNARRNMMDQQQGSMQQMRSQAFQAAGAEESRQVGDLQGMMSLGRGPAVSNYTPTYQQGTQATDVAGIGLGYTNLQQQARENELDRQAALRVGSGGGGGQQAVSAYDQARTQQIQLQNQALANEMKNGNKSPSVWSQLGSGLLNLGGNVLGNWIGNQMK